MNFNDAMVAVRASAAPTVNIPEQWGQGRATFGGMLAAVLFEKVATQVAQRTVRYVLCCCPLLPLLLLGQWRSR